MTQEKKHADFQHRYKKSSNFNKETKDVNLKPDGKGNLVKKESDEKTSESDKEKIYDAMDKMHRNIEMIPGDEADDEE